MKNDVAGNFLAIQNGRSPTAARMQDSSKAGRNTGACFSFAATSRFRKTLGTRREVPYATRSDQAESLTLGTATTKVGNWHACAAAQNVLKLSADVMKILPATVAGSHTLLDLI